MTMNLTRKILSAHLAKPSSMIPGEEIFVKVDQTLTHDINAVMTYLAFEAIGLPRTQVETSVSYLDHNLLYLDHKTPDDHIYLQSAAKSSAYTSPVRATASATPFIWRALGSRASSAWAATAIPHTAAPSACCASA